MRDFIETQVKLYLAGSSKLSKSKLVSLIVNYYGEGYQELVAKLNEVK